MLKSGAEKTVVWVTEALEVGHSMPYTPMGSEMARRQRLFPGSSLCVILLHLLLPVLSKEHA